MSQVSRCPVMHFYGNAQEFVHENIISEKNRYNVTTGRELIVNVVNTIKDLGFFVYFVAVAKKVSEAVIDFFAAFVKVFENISFEGIVAAISIPTILKDLIDRIKAFIQSCKDNISSVYVKASRITTAVLDLVGSGVDITKVVAAFVMNSTFSVVAGFISGIEVIIQGKEFYNGVTFYKIVRKEGFDLSKVDDYDFDKRMNPSPGFDKTKADLANVAVNKKRIIQRIVSHGLKILAAVVNIVAAAIFLTCPLLAPVTAGMVAFSTIITLSEFLLDRIVCYQWQKAISDKVLIS